MKTQLLIRPSTANAATTIARTVKIICRNVIYQCIVAKPRPYQKPQALNWRYRFPGETYDRLPDPDLQYQKPRALNWRWQLKND